MTAPKIINITWAPGNHDRLIKQPHPLWLALRNIPSIMNRVPVQRHMVDVSYRTYEGMTAGCNPQIHLTHAYALRSADGCCRDHT